jgi:hypothetical protein
MPAVEPRHRLRRRAGAESAFRTAVLAIALAAAPAGRAAGAAGPLLGKPLATYSTPGGPTLFTEIPAGVTGIETENRYADPKMWGALYQEFESGSVGTGVAIGDYDGDGRPDIFVVSKTESCRLFRNLGHFKFADVTDQAGVGDPGDAAQVWKQGATFVDVDNDGRLDLYVCRFNAPNLLYINQGDGTFKEMAHAWGLDVRDASVMAAFCDYDCDGWLDVYITTNLLDSIQHPSGQRGHLLHNNRNGTFTDVTARAGIAGETQSHSAIWWDYDNDGWPGLYVANDYGKPDELYHNNRDGTFTERSGQALPHTSFSSMGSDVGDVNNDGRIDLLVADMAATTHFKDQRSAADSRGRTDELPKGATTAPKYHRNALLLNTGTGHALEAAFLAGIASTDWTWSVRLEDLDNDGRLDLVVTNGFPRDPSLDVMKRIMGAESPSERIRIMHASPVLKENNLAFRNLGNLRFENVSAAWGLGQNGVSFGAALGDLDGDGDLDMVYSNYEAGVTVLRNDCTAGHRIEFDLRGTRSNRFGIGATVRLESRLGVQTGQLVLARGYMSVSEPMLHFGLGEDTTIDRLTVTWPGGLVQTFQDLSADQRYTIVEPAGPGPSSAPPPESAGAFIEVSHDTGLALTSPEEPVEETALQPLLPRRLNRRGPAVAVTEEQGRTLVAIGGTTVSPARILVSTGGGFAPLDTARLLPIGPVDDGPLLFLDANGDGYADLLVTRGGNSLPEGVPEYQPKLDLADGQGGFHAAPANALPELTTSVGAVAAGDFDHSGRLGVFLGGRVSTGQYPTAPRSALWANRGGRFEDVTDTLAPALRQAGMVTAALWSDVDLDGWADLLLTLEWGGVKYFHNDHGHGFEDWSKQAGFSAAGTGWWTSLAAADFNGDNRPDYVVGNTGLNTQYQASVKEPALLFAGDFKGEGFDQLIEGYYENGILYPWRSRRDLGAVLPSILKRYPRIDDYARASLADVVGPEKLAAAQRFAATELHSGVFLSQPDGGFLFEPLPRIAQISPLQGLAAKDFDGDGRADLYAVQNSYAPIPAVGHDDGGLSQLLRGDGRGHFIPVPPAESNLVVPGDAKALAILDLNRDGWPDFLISRNNSSTLAFRNQRVPGRNMLCVRLHGPAGNPDAIGARLTLELRDGSAQTCETYAGSGYYSQSIAAAFFGFLDSNPPVRLQIRWPSGATSHLAVPAHSSRIDVSAP